MKKLTQISLILFITALTFSSCEEDVLVDFSQNNVDNQSTSSNSNTQAPDRMQEDNNERLYKVEENRESR